MIGQLSKSNLQTVIERKVEVSLDGMVELELIFRGQLSEQGRGENFGKRSDFKGLIAIVNGLQRIIYPDGAIKINRTIVDEGNGKLGPVWEIAKRLKDAVRLSVRYAGLELKVVCCGIRITDTAAGRDDK